MLHFYNLEHAKQYEKALVTNMLPGLSRISK